MTTEGGGVRLEFEALVLGDEGGGCILSILGLGEALFNITGRVGWGRAGNILCDWLDWYCCEFEDDEDEDPALVV